MPGHKTSAGKNICIYLVSMRKAHLYFAPNKPHTNHTYINIEKKICIIGSDIDKTCHTDKHGQRGKNPISFEFWISGRKICKRSTLRLTLLMHNQWTHIHTDAHDSQTLVFSVRFLYHTSRAILSLLATYTLGICKFHCHFCIRFATHTHRHLSANVRSECGTMTPKQIKKISKQQKPFQSAPFHSKIPQWEQQKEKRPYALINSSFD